MSPIDLDKLKKLLGQFLNSQGIPCQVIEILADGPALVLRDTSTRKVIQANQYGDAGEWVTETFTVAVFDAQHGGLNPDLPELATLNLLD